MLLEQLVADIDRICEADPAAFADMESIKVLRRQLARLDAAATRSTASFDASGDWKESGARSLSSWLADACNLPKSETQRQISNGRALGHMPLVEEAWLAGDISAAHVGVLAGACSEKRRETFERDEKMLLDDAKFMRFRDYWRAVRYWEQCADPDSVEKDAQDERDQREVFLSQSFRGMWLGKMTFDPVSGTIVNNELRRLEQQLFEDDWAEARARLGDKATAADLRRTPAQRRADALVEMATRSRTAPADGKRPDPLFSVFVDYETFAGRICQLANGTVVTPGCLVDWLDRAWIERVVFDGPSRIIDMGVRQRLFTGATRRAVQLRDRECFHPFCDLPAEDCQVDHVVPYAAGGETIQANGRRRAPSTTSTATDDRSHRLPPERWRRMAHATARPEPARAGAAERTRGS